ncbi:hypothetical protein FBU30_005534 [Linnemannia zychae]|nr:hypothetical protein FBU30_005534 [Linnemannia zychae]
MGNVFSHQHEERDIYQQERDTIAAKIIREQKREQEQERRLEKKRELGREREREREREQQRLKEQAQELLGYKTKRILQEARTKAAIHSQSFHDENDRRENGDNFIIECSDPWRSKTLQNYDIEYVEDEQGYFDHDGYYHIPQNQYHAKNDQQLNWRAVRKLNNAYIPKPRQKKGRRGKGDLFEYDYHAGYSKSEIQSKSSEQKAAYEVQKLRHWLERDGSYKRIFGSSGKTIIGKDTETARKAYQEWANHVNLYKKIKSNEHLTGFGLTEEDYKDEVTTIAKRYEKDCPRFARMDKIFAKKPTVHALVSMEGSINRRLEVQGADITTEQLKDSDDEIASGNDNDDYQDERTDELQDIPIDQDDNIIDQNIQDVLTVFRSGKRISNAQVAPQGKRKKTERHHKPLPSLNVGHSQPKAVVTIETSKLAWEKEKWEKEAAIRDQRLESNLEAQRLSIISDLLKQGIADKELFAQVLNRTE